MTTNEFKFVPMRRDGELITAEAPLQVQLAIWNALRAGSRGDDLREALRPYGLVPEQIAVPTFEFAFRETNR